MPGSTTRNDPPARDERIEVFLENTSDVVVIVDARGAITYGTPSLGHNLGLPTSETLGRKLVEFLCDPDAAEAAAVFDGFAARTAATQLITDWHLRHQDGTAVAFEVLSHNLLGDPRVAGITLTMRDVSERRTLEAQLEHQGFHDALTGLPNRALFQDRAEHALARTSRLGSVVALLVLDLDDFQAINAAHGLAAGDGLLVQVATRLRSTLLDGATVSRSGGDEFTMLLIDVRPEDVSLLLERLDNAVTASNFERRDDAQTAWHLGISLGAAYFDPDTPTDVEVLLRNADEAQYVEKHRRKALRAEAA